MGPDKKGLSRKYMHAEIEESLKRLQIDTIDLYQSHRDDTETPMTEILESYADLIKQGKVRAIGCSNFSGARLKEANAVARTHNLPRYEVIQPKYNLYDRAEYEIELEQACIKEEVGVIPYYGLANGFLTGKYRGPEDFNKGARGSRMDSYLNPRGRRILAALDEVSAAHKVKPAAVALAWLMARPSITAPIASATKPEQLVDFADAARITLSRADIAALDAASAN
jgi:aryl-alcohol dehydrogenase-like predicted oxidoreductase